jgi:hypothetical protein
MIRATVHAPCPRPGSAPRPSKAFCRRLILTGLGADTPITVTRQRTKISIAISLSEAAQAKAIALPI